MDTENRAERETIRVPAAGPVAKEYAIQHAAGVSGPWTWSSAHRHLAEHPELAELNPRVVAL